MKNLIIRLPDKDHKKLKLVSVKQGESMQVIVATLIAEYLKKD